jgi:hypothetical protein
MPCPVGKPVKMVINAQDVIHDVGLPHFRMKMDAVPGIPTTQWFTPKYTTEEMKQMTTTLILCTRSVATRCAVKVIFYERCYKL